jgi:septum formation topological specificity factor MinE
MAQTVLAPNPPTWGNYLSGKWSVEELGLRIEYNIANREAWRILKDQDEDVKSGVLTTLHRYSITWTPEDAASKLEDDDSDEFEDEEFENLALDTGKIITLYTAAEIDFERGLKFVREVEKGSHLKPNTTPSFRPEALKVLCEVVQIALEKLDPEPEEGEEEDEEEDGDDDDPWNEEDNGEDEDGDEDAAVSGDETGQSSKAAVDTMARSKTDARLTKEQILQMEADESEKEQKQHRDLIDNVYKSSEEQFKARLQLLVHQHRLKERKATKK